MDQLLLFIVVVLKSKYKIEDIQPFCSSVLNGVHLWILHADKIPPHIGISINDKFYSLKAKGKDEGVAIKGLLAIVERKEITTLCLELDVQLDEMDVQSVFKGFSKTIPNEITCLDPIKILLNCPHVSYLIELLETLNETDLVKSRYGLYINNFEGIPLYSTSDIHKRLASLGE